MSEEDIQSNQPRGTAILWFLFRNLICYSFCALLLERLSYAQLVSMVNSDDDREHEDFEDDTFDDEVSDDGDFEPEVQSDVYDFESVASRDLEDHMDDDNTVLGTPSDRVYFCKNKEVAWHTTPRNTNFSSSNVPETVHSHIKSTRIRR